MPERLSVKMLKKALWLVANKRTTMRASTNQKTWYVLRAKSTHSKISAKLVREYKLALYGDLPESAAEKADPKEQLKTLIEKCQSMHSLYAPGGPTSPD